MTQLVLEPDGTVEVHISDIMAFKHCRRAWSYSSRLQQNLEPKRPYTPFFFGRMVHYALERWYAHQQDFDVSIGDFLGPELATIRSHGAIWAEEEAMINEQVELARGLLVHRGQWEDRLSRARQHRYTLSNMEFITLEQTFKVPLLHPVSHRPSRKFFFAGRLDGLVRLKDDGSIWIWEEKTARSVEQRLAMLGNDEQASAYIWAARQVFGSNLKGIIYTVMGKRVPPPVKRNANGMLSKDVRNQTFDSYLDAIKEWHGTEASQEFIRDQYGDTLMALIESKNTYFERAAIIRNETALENTQADLWYVARDMASRQLAIYPTSGPHCNYCIFKDPCLAKQNGADEADVLEANYILRSKPEEVLTDEAA